METILQRDMLQLLGRVDENGHQQPCTISCYIEDGELVTYENVRVCVGRDKKTGKVIVDQRPRKPGAVRRNPNHFKNSTRNFVLPNGQIRKAHIRLITMWNGKKVVP